jgi:F-type H+-transporting ATPase subunit delta
MKKLRPKDLAQALFELTDGKDEKELPQVMKGLTLLLAKKQMLGKAENIFTEYRTIYNKAHGIVEATVTLINRMEPATKQKLTESLKQKYQAKEVQMNEKVDARLIGGLKIRVADTVYDMSIKHTLDQLEAKLTA